MNKDYLSSLLKKETGTGFSDHVNQLRMLDNAAQNSIEWFKQSELNINRFCEQANTVLVELVMDSSLKQLANAEKMSEADRMYYAGKVIKSFNAIRGNHPGIAAVSYYGKDGFTLKASESVNHVARDTNKEDLYYTTEMFRKEDGRKGLWWTGGYTNQDLELAVPEYGNISRLSGRHESGGGGLVCTVDEYCKLLEALANDGVGGTGVRILTGESIEKMSRNRLDGRQLEDFHRSGKREYGYGLGVRTLMDREASESPMGEFGWDGAAGAYALADPVNHISIFYAQVMATTPVVHGVIHPTLRDLIYGALKQKTFRRSPFRFTWENPRAYDSVPGISPLRDPFILRDGNFWYLTGTLPPYDVAEETFRTKGVPLYRSGDLKRWTFVDYIVRTPAEAEGKWYSERFWAPEIFRRNGKYYVTANCSGLGASAQSTMGHLFARSDYIEGPYTIMNPDKPLRLGNDAHLFSDEDGRVYLFASGIWCAELDLDNLRFLEEGRCPVVPVPGSDAWNGRRERVDFEGPFVMKYQGRYYMFYSTWARGYEVGVAVADSPKGKWTLMPDPMYGSINRGSCREYGGIYQEGCYPAQDKYRESGHNSVFEGPDGEPWIAAHAYDYASGDVKLVMDKLIFDKTGGVAVADTVSGKAVKGPTWGSSAVDCETEPGGRAPVHALDVWIYVPEGGKGQLPDQVDILLENGFRTGAPVRWDGQPLCGREDGERVRGTAVYRGKVYSCTAHVLPAVVPPEAV